MMPFAVGVTSEQVGEVVVHCAAARDGATERPQTTAHARAQATADDRTQPTIPCEGLPERMKLNPASPSRCGRRLTREWPPGQHGRVRTRVRPGGRAPRWTSNALASRTAP